MKYGILWLEALLGLTLAPVLLQLHFSKNKISSKVFCTLVIRWWKALLLFILYSAYNNINNRSTIKTAPTAPKATVKRLWFRYAKITATISPTTADAMPDVEYRIAGSVIAVNTAYGV